MAKDEEQDERASGAPPPEEELSPGGVISGTVLVRREPAGAPPPAQGATPPAAQEGPAGSQKQTPFQPGDVFRHVEILLLLGKGYSGEVYLVRDRRSGELRALKVMRPRDGDARSVERSLAEAESTFGIRHANVVHVFDIDREPDDTIWMLMDYIEGSSLEEILRRQGRLSPRWALRIALGIAWGLDAAHENQVIHRDVKPPNVLMTDDWEPVLIDFSIAKHVPREMVTTQPNLKLGTPGYMAPEYLDGAPLDARMDIYALGLVLWRMLAGEHPYQEGMGDITRLIYLQVTRDPKPLSHVVGLPGYVDALVSRATARNPDDRFMSAAEFAKAIQAVLAQVERDLREGRVVAPLLPGEPPLPNERAPAVYVSPTTGPTLELPAPVPSARVVVDAPRTPAGPGGTTAVGAAAIRAAAADPRPEWARSKASGGKAPEATGPMLRSIQPAGGERKEASRREQGTSGRQPAPLWALLPVAVASALLSGFLVRWMEPAGGATAAPSATATAISVAPPEVTPAPAPAAASDEKATASAASASAPPAAASPAPAAASSASAPARPRAPARKRSSPPAGDTLDDDFFLRPPPKAPPSKRLPKEFVIE